MMNSLLTRLSGGDLRSDGNADEVAVEVIENPDLLNLLLEGLSSSDDVIRARVAHAMEKISRSHHRLLQNALVQISNISVHDKVPMVRWHMAMIFGNIDYSEEDTQLVVSTLFQLLNDESVFVKSWAIVSLCIAAKKKRRLRDTIAERIKTLEKGDSVAIRTRVKKALEILGDDKKGIPLSWIKAQK
jgi:HEAT repeat protein